MRVHEYIDTLTIGAGAVVHRCGCGRIYKTMPGLERHLARLAAPR